MEARLILDIIQEMLDAECSLEQIKKAVANLKAKEEEKAEKRREDGARRQRKYQARKDAGKNNKSDASESSDSVRTRQNASERVSGASPSKDNRAERVARADMLIPVGTSYEVPPIVNPPLPSVEAPIEKKSSRGSSLPEDWKPTPELIAYGADLGISESQSREILENMRLWAIANKNRAIARKSDWTATMQGALRRDAPKYKARAGPAHRSESGKRGAASLLAEIYERDHEQRNQKTPDLGDVRSLPVVPREPGGNGGVSRLISASFKRV